MTRGGRIGLAERRLPERVARRTLRPACRTSLRNLPKRPGMVRNLRHLFQRGEVTEQELRTLHGVVTELALGRRQRGRLEKDGEG